MRRRELPAAPVIVILAGGVCRVRAFFLVDVNKGPGDTAAAFRPDHDESGE
jgi:hypothetical protein